LGRELVWWTLRYLALDGTNHESHRTHARMIRRYIPLSKPQRSRPHPGTSLESDGESESQRPTVSRRWRRESTTARARH
jgi:hypothetical protein